MSGAWQTHVKKGDGNNNNGLEIRVIRLESKVDHIQNDVTDLKYSLKRLDDKIDQRSSELDSKFENKFLGLDTKFEKKFTELNTKFENKFSEFEIKIENKFSAFEIKIENRISGFETKVEKKFSEVDIRLGKIDSVLCQLVTETAWTRYGIFTIAGLALIAIIKLFWHSIV